MKFEQEIKEFEERKAMALAMGGPKKLAKFKAKGSLNARERLEYLLDKGTFRESGLFVKGEVPEQREDSPCDGRITGFGKVNDRMVGAISNDFTVYGATSTSYNSQKQSYLKGVCDRNGYPMIILGEAGGGRIPDNMGAANLHYQALGKKYVRYRTTPWVNAITGPSFGACCWNACLSDFVVMKKGACLAVASPRLCSTATNSEVSAEDLGGWKLHSQVTGIADVVVETDYEAIDTIKRFLSYMPSHNLTTSPVAEVPEGSDDAVKNILEILPEKRSQVYDVKKIIQAIVDKGSMFEIKARFGRAMTTCFARINGRVVGIIANNPYYLAGAMDYSASDKTINMMVLCDSYNIPILWLVDQPGFIIGVEGERHRMPGKIMNWMNALAQVTVPSFAIQIRKNYGQAVLNMGTTTSVQCMGAWWSAETSFMDPHSALNVVKGITYEDDPERYTEALGSYTSENNVYELGRVFGCHQIIDPRESRDYMKDMLEIHASPKNSIGKHQLRNWPTTV